jgi:integrase
LSTKIDTVAGRKKLKPRREPYWAPISDIDGAYIGFRSGPNTWIARLREEGSQKTHSLGKFEDHREAVREARSWIKSRLKGVTQHDATVADACIAYLKNYENENSGRGLQDVRSILERAVIGRDSKPNQVKADRISKIPLAKLNPVHVEEWRDKLVADGLDGDDLRKARATANRKLSAFKAALNFAFKRRMTDSDFAWKGIDKFKNVQARDARRHISLEERRALLNAAAEVGQGAIRDFLEGLMSTGARPVELTRAIVADYEPSTGMLALTSYKGKGSGARIRQVPLRALKAEQLIMLLCKDKLPNASIFLRDDGKPWEHSDWDHLVREARERAGILKVTAYDLRHTFISEALANGVDPLTVSRIAGTSLEMISQTYGKLIEDHAVEVFKDINLV